MLFILCIFMTLPVILLAGVPIENASAFSQPAMGIFLVGLAGILISRNQPRYLKPRYMFVLTVNVWVVVSLLAAIPFYQSSLQLSWTDAIFESISGITTTGSTVLSGLDNMAPEILIWRSILQWLGGIGIIGMFVAVLPFLGIGGMRLFATESSEWTDKELPRMKSLGRGLLLIYSFFTFSCAMVYWFSGMSLFDAVNHALTTLSTGGYSTSDMSMGKFESDLLLFESTFFMMLGGLPFFLFVRELHGQHGVLLRDQQVKAFLSFLLLVTTLLTLHRCYVQPDIEPFSAFAAVLFNVTSVVTTTGYASEDYSLWGPLAYTAFLFLTFVGGCSGSTSGGMKIFRFQLSFMALREQLTRLIHPRAVLTRNYNGRPVSDAIITSLIAYGFVFVFCLLVMTLALASLGLDFMTSLTGSLTALTNVGPGLGDVIGPAGNFQTLPDAAKWILTAGMLMGRLELLSVIVLFSPVFWRN
ncbi:MAG: TrkH family potassium uptake protein [Marinobacter sp.]|uniref:TrkH family potassium uptake protein n=1 Tax=Marinobacter sp. TaxID=50741 RepID=UPI0034A00A18